jgi:large subunit ribosomal protein L34e
MTATRHRSSSAKRVSRRTPGGRVAAHYKRKIPGAARCGLCGATLNAKRAASRKFGGCLCSGCSRSVLTAEARVRSGETDLRGVALKQRGYVKRLFGKTA